MTIFAKIIRGEIPCYKIAENEKFFAFLDVNPLVEGHTLIVPKIEIDKLVKCCCLQSLLPKQLKMPLIVTDAE
jgi:diadenosine tetraphosphate (Ap4A) HIT family hydrolase